MCPFRKLLDIKCTDSCIELRIKTVDLADAAFAEGIGCHWIKVWIVHSIQSSNLCSQ